ncbi:MAG: glycosyltransferase family 4 protein, partial [Bacteroidota bacterium]|nr:glycosyltransferase family 4 protein [Bacteroidota bacterium]
MTKKRILILTDWYEPGYKAGGTIQSCRNFVAAMRDSFDVSVLTSDRDLGDTKGYPGIPPNQWIEREPGVPVYYAIRESLSTRTLKELIRSLKPDFIYLNSMYSYQFTILPLILHLEKKIQAQIILAPHGMLQEGALKFKSLKKKAFISLLNLLGIPGQIHFQATDEQERKDILKQFPRAGKVELVPNFSGLVTGAVAPVEKVPHRLRCIYISRIIQKKNILFFLKLLHRIPADIELEFTIYGDVEDEKYWQQAEKIIHSLPKHVQVLFKGTLPHDQVMSALASNHVFVLPTLGENFGYAIYEAFCAGRPVLISDKTPWRGLQDQQVGWDIPL